MTPGLHCSTRGGRRPELSTALHLTSRVTLDKLLLASVSLSFYLHKIGRTSTCLNRLLVKIKKENVAKVPGIVTGAQPTLRER